MEKIETVSRAAAVGYSPRPMNKTIFAAIVIAAFVRAALALDKLEPPAGPAVEGFLLSYDKGTFNFMTQEKKTVHERPSAVKKITLDKPLKGSLELKTKRGGKDEIMLVGFDGGNFIISRGGREEKLPSINVAAIHLDSGNARSMDELSDGDNIISKGEEVDLAHVAEAGKVTVLQFHQPGVITSERTANYLAALVRQNKGKVVFKRIVCEKGTEPVARQNKVATFPQFWFYNKSGQLNEKLTDRFTEQDILDAIKKASK